MQGELLPQVAQEMGGLSPKLEEIIRALEWSRLETLVGSKASGPGHPEMDRCAMVSAFLAKSILGIGTTRGLIERLEADRKLQRICGFGIGKSLPSESTFSRAFAEFARDRIGQRAHERMIRETLGEQLIGQISRDSTAIEARERVAEAKPAAGEVVTDATPVTADLAAAATAAASATVTEAAPVKRGRPRKGSVRPTPVSKSPVDRQVGQSVTQMLADLPTGCSVGTKTNAAGFKSSWRGYKLHLDTACCGVVISALLTGAAVHDSRVALPLSSLSAGRVTACYELMDAAYCSATIRSWVQQQGRVPLVDHNPRGGAKIEFAPHEAVRYNTRTSAERTNARLKDQFGADQLRVRGADKVMAHLMFGVIALCADQFTRLIL